MAPGLPERRVAASLDRLTDDGLLAAQDSATGLMRSYLPTGRRRGQPDVGYVMRSAT